MGSSRGDYDAPTPSTGVGTPRYNPQTPAAGTPAFPAATPGFENDPPTFAAPTPGGAGMAAATPYGAAPTPGGGGDYAAASSGAPFCSASLTPQAQSTQTHAGMAMQLETYVHPVVKP